MCDYSLQHLASRPARLGDKLITTKFPSTPTGGFAEVGHPNIAVCLLPGTELAFETEIEQSAWFPLLRPRKLGATVARFRRVNENFESAHHDGNVKFVHQRLVFPIAHHSAYMTGRDESLHAVVGRSQQ